MSDPSNWLDVAAEVFGGEPEKAPSIVEKIKRKPRATGGLSRSLRIRLWLEVHPFIYAMLAVAFFLGVTLIPAYLIVAAISTASDTTNTACVDMLNWSISSIPARCLAELSKVMPR